MNQFVLCVAQGLFIGRIPFMPGTFGSALGLLWFGLLLASHNPWLYGAGTLFGLACSVWFCGKAESILGRTDPGSVVLDEITAIPVAFAGWLGLHLGRDGQMPGPESLWVRPGLWWVLGIFLAFRLFDIAKPWPVRQSQDLPGGWGVTIDDVLAAIYVTFGVMIIWALIPPASR